MLTLSVNGTLTPLFSHQSKKWVSISLFYIHNYGECVDNRSVWKIVHNFLMSTEFSFDTKVCRKSYLTQVRGVVSLVTHACWRHWWRWGGWPTWLASPFIGTFYVAWWRYIAGYVRNTVYHGLQKKEQFNTEQQHTNEGYSHRASALTFALTLTLTLERNTLVSIAPSTPSIDISINTMRQNSICFWTDPKASTLTSMWTSSVWTRLNCKLAH